MPTIGRRGIYLHTFVGQNTKAHHALLGMIKYIFLNSTYFQLLFIYMYMNNNGDMVIMSTSLFDASHHI